jgi:hypothetical protein
MAESISRMTEATNVKQYVKLLPLHTAGSLWERGDGVRGLLTAK